MRKSLLAAAFTAVMLLGIIGSATAQPAADDEGHRPNDHGLCTAYFNGQKNGWNGTENQPAPFDTLEATGREYTDHDGVDNDMDGDTDEENENEDISAQENVFNYCFYESYISGNTDHGRYSCVAGEAAADADSDPDCQDNPAPGNS